MWHVTGPPHEPQRRPCAPESRCTGGAAGVQEGEGDRLSLRPRFGLPERGDEERMVCHMLEGEVWVKQGDVEYTTKPGQVFSCAMGQFEEDKNQSNAAAVMRVIDLLPA